MVAKKVEKLQDPPEIPGWVQHQPKRQVHQQEERRSGEGPRSEGKQRSIPSINESKQEQQERRKAQEKIDLVSSELLSTRYWEKMVQDMQAGNVTQHISQWCSLTSDPEILDTVSGLPIELVDDLTSPNHFHQYPFKTEEHKFVEEEIQRLIALGAIVPSSHELDEHVSPIFVRPKDDGAYRLILNLKKLNDATEYIHFKMDTLESILCLITPGAYMAKIDIKDAYYSVQGFCYQKCGAANFRGRGRRIL